MTAKRPNRRLEVPKSTKFFKRCDASPDNDLEREAGGPHCDCEFTGINLSSTMSYLFLCGWLKEHEGMLFRNQCCTSSCPPDTVGPGVSRPALQAPYGTRARRREKGRLAAREGVHEVIVHYTADWWGTSQVPQRGHSHLFSFWGESTDYDEKYHGNWCRSTSLRAGRDGKGAVIWGLVRPTSRLNVRS